MRHSEHAKVCRNNQADEPSSPTLMSSRFSVNFDDFNDEAFEKENCSLPGKFSVMKEKHLQKFIR